jgi:hypothetical protein
LNVKNILKTLVSFANNFVVSGSITNLRVLPKLGFLNDEPIIIKAEVFYATQSINYKPGFWEEVKWAWMQYLSILAIVIYFIKKGLTRMFISKRLRSYVIVPWQQK